MNFIKNNSAGIFLCLAIALPSWLLGRLFPVIGGAIISILAGMTAALFIKNRQKFEKGIKFTSKKILQWAVILLGFGMNLNCDIRDRPPVPSYNHKYYNCFSDYRLCAPQSHENTV